MRARLCGETYCWLDLLAAAEAEDKNQSTSPSADFNWFPSLSLESSKVTRSLLAPRAERKVGDNDKDSQSLIISRVLVIYSHPHSQKSLSWFLKWANKGRGNSTSLVQTSCFTRRI